MTAGGLTMVVTCEKKNNGHVARHFETINENPIEHVKQLVSEVQLEHCIEQGMHKIDPNDKNS